MTETTPQTDAIDATPGTIPDDTAPQPADTDHALAATAARREAAKYRDRAHEAEHRADELQARYQTATAHLAAARRGLLKHTDVFGRIDPQAMDDALDMLDIDALYHDDGTLDDDALEQAVTDLVTSKPYMARQRAITQATRELLSHSEPHLTGGTAGGDRLRNALSR
ncbi:hypothetical protein JS533_009075 [Bifidobacterium amazonense]|uniref:Uncharacterized protein n=1 Tax=Bifidobacterium amazonense TaxID=2809027 RepID=A0ABS9VWX5_9BIFI|nr:hypothetical protein [Bifidobacterium amazonense]MCH9276416.1 hypothetical protein [Bifidobacterium amazonense]